MKTLLHICCAPCANRCIDVLRGDKFEVTGFWYNPNIHPFTEYRSRRNCLRDYAATIDLPVIERNDYGLRPFVRAVAEDLENRCGVCYEMRLFEAARQAAAQYGVAFLYRDFRPYFRAGQEKARELGFYMQKYCGCVFTEEERYLKKNKIVP